MGHDVVQLSRDPGALLQQCPPSTEFFAALQLREQPLSGFPPATDVVAGHQGDPRQRGEQGQIGLTGRRPRPAETGHHQERRPGRERDRPAVYDGHPEQHHDRAEHHRRRPGRGGLVRDRRTVE